MLSMCATRGDVVCSRAIHCPSDVLALTRQTGDKSPYYKRSTHISAYLCDTVQNSMPKPSQDRADSERAAQLAALANRVAAAVRRGDLAAAEAMLRNAAPRATCPAQPPTVVDDSPPEAVPRRFMLWVDGVGSYLVLTKPALTIGRWREDSDADLLLRADVSRRHARIQRFDGDWFLASFKPVKVNGKPVGSALLSDGDKIILGRSPAATFRLPTALSATATLSFAGNCLPSRDTRSVVLMADRLILAPDGAGHIVGKHADARVVLFWADGGLRCQVEGNVILNGRSRGAPCPVRLGDRIETRGWSFSLTADAV